MRYVADHDRAYRMTLRCFRAATWFAVVSCAFYLGAALAPNAFIGLPLLIAGVAAWVLSLMASKASNRWHEVWKKETA